MILIPEIPYDLDQVAGAIMRRTRAGKSFSIVAVAEGAMSTGQAEKIHELATAKDQAQTKEEKKKASRVLEEFHKQHVNHTVELTTRLEELTGLESRLSILGHLQRGGIPSATDRLLATRLGTACAETLHRGTTGVMMAVRDQKIEPTPLADVAGKKKLVPVDHPWINSARHVGVCLGND